MPLIRTIHGRQLRWIVALIALCPLILLARGAAPASEPETRPSTPAAAAVAQPGAATAPASQSSSTEPASTAPSTQQQSDIRLNFKDAPLDSVLQYLSEVAGFVVVKDVDTDARVTVMSIQPVTASQAVTLLNTILSANGLSAIESGRTLRVVRTERAKKGDIPVHFGADPSQIEQTDELITQVIPIKNVDAVKLHQDLKPIIGGQADIASNAGSNAIVITDTSANVRRIVEIINTLDKSEVAGSSVMKVIQLKNASAESAVHLVLSIFHSERPSLRGADPNQTRMLLEMQQNRGKALGGGVDQALHGGGVTAAADPRTNTVIVAGPVETVKLIENMLHDLDGNDSSISSIRSFHLKSADASSVAHVITNMFQEETEGQTRISSQGVRNHVTASAEDRTNTVIVTAPPGAMTIIEGIIRDLESNPGISPNIRAYHLKFADAATIEKVLGSVFQEERGRYRPLGTRQEHINVTSEVRTNTVVVTGSPEALRVVDNLVKDLDVSPSAAQDVKFFHLKSADATNAAKTILSFFKPPDGAQKADAEKYYVPVNATADDRTNTVMATAPPEAMKVIEQIVQELESDPSQNFEFRSYELMYADAGATAKQLQAIFSPDPSQVAAYDRTKPPPRDALHARVVVASDDRTNTVMVTAPVDTLKVIDGMIKQLDANPAAAADLQIFQLLNADATDAAKLIDSIFNPTDTPAGGRRSSSPSPDGSALDNNHHAGRVHASADDRTNTLVVTAPGELLKVVERIIRQLDSNPISQDTFFMYRLRNGQAKNLELVLNEMFGNYPSAGMGGIGGTSGSRTSSSSSYSNLSSQRSGFGGSSSSAFGSSSLSSRTGSSSTNRSSSGSSAYGSMMPGMMHAYNELTGQVFVVADTDTNSLLVTTATKYQKQVRQIIEQLDRPVPQVLIKVLVAEVTHDNAADWGVDFSILNQRLSGKGETVNQSMGNTDAMKANGGLAVSLLEGNVQGTLHALATEGKLDVLSRPYILASDNQQASISVGQQVPIVTDVRVTDTGQLIATPTYQQVGIILNVTPHINPDGLVILDVAPEISQLTNSNITIAPGVSSPIFNQRTAQSRVGIQNGQTIVIGGLMEDRKNTTINKVPILGDIPLIGELFRRTQTDKTKTELLIFMTPHVAQQPSSLADMSKDQMRDTKLTPNAVERGTFQDHLMGMERGAVPHTPSTQPAVEVVPFDNATTEPSAIPPSPPIHIPAR